MTYQTPPIVRLAERLLVDVEEAATRFIRRHRYTFGSALRTEAFEVALLAKRAWRERSRTASLVGELAVLFDRFKLRLMLGRRINAFRSFAEYEALARLAVDLGKQIGGWYRQLHPTRQNSTAPSGPPERSQILSTRAASRTAEATS